jgi:peroxiredoxin
MKRPFLLALVLLSLFSAAACAAPADAQRVEHSFQLAMEKWAAEVASASTPETRMKAWSARPDPATFAKNMWDFIRPALRDEWTLEPAAWFLTLTCGQRITRPDGSNLPAFAEETQAIHAAIEAYHMKSAKLPPVCLALVPSDDPHALVLLEKVRTGHADKTVQGVAALAIAMRLKALGDDPGLMTRRLTLLRQAIIESAQVEIHGTSVAKLAEDELYIIRFLTKNRVAPDLVGMDSGNRPLLLSDYKDKVVVLLFWNSGMQEAARVLEMTNAMAKKFAGKPFAVIGVNNDPTDNLREMQKPDKLVTFPNFSDPQNRLARDYRVGSWPLVYVLDGKRKIHYTGLPGSFVELTAAALLDEAKPAAAK